MDRFQVSGELGKARRLLEQASTIIEDLVEGLASEAPEMDTLQTANEPLQAIIAAIDSILAFEDEREERDDEAEVPGKGDNDDEAEA
jgi:hypothetical protein